MTLADERLGELDGRPLTADGRARARCRAAAELINKGQYLAAGDVLGDLWRGVGQRPADEGLPGEVGAELLLQCGTLTGWLGTVRHVSGAQEQAQDLLSEALRKFQTLGLASKVAEAQYELGMCYWRLGQFAEARIVLHEALRSLADADFDLKAKILIRRSVIEIWDNRYHEALAVLKEAESVFEPLSDHVKGRWHGQMALVLDKLATAERSAERSDRAIIEYTAAIFHYERAGHDRHCATNLNNLAMLLFKLGRYAQAHEHLERARVIYARLQDPGTLAQVDETRARVLVAEKRYREACRVLAGVLRVLEEGGEAALLADALTVQGVALARQGEFEESVNVLRRAMRVAEGAGANTQAGLAALTLIEEHGACHRLTDSELAEVYRSADELLRDTQDAEDIARLRACGRVVVRRLSGMQMHDRNFSFYDAVHELEARLIEKALELESGSVSRAARRLGLKHQSLAHMLTARHKDLMEKRTPPGRRHRSIIRKES